MPAGYRLYAVGDVHGRSDLLEDLLRQIERDFQSRADANNILVFLGDLIDRGPSSAQVVERIRTYTHPNVRTVALCGNHEEILIRILRGEDSLIDDWLRYGGTECLESYGIDRTEISQLSEAKQRALIKESIPPEHQEFLFSLADTFRAGGYLLVHAGIRPGVDFKEQDQADLRWIRDPFLSSNRRHGYVVIHGHTISEEIEVRENRIGIDTGAYSSGILSAVGLEGTKRWFLRAEEAHIIQSPAPPPVRSRAFG